MAKRPNFIDMTGWKMWEHGVPDSWITVISLAEPYISPKDGHKRQMWLCRCQCGKEFLCLGHRIRHGITKSCGCKPQADGYDFITNLGKKNKTHGDTGTRLYKIWSSMKARCNNPHDGHYKDYGERGIAVCDEWMMSYEDFKKWAEENGYKNNLTIDRIDVNGNYEPSNCRWANSTEQANNRRSSVLLDYNGETMTISQWAKRIGIKTVTLHARIKRYGWSIERALTEPVFVKLQ